MTRGEAILDLITLFCGGKPPPAICQIALGTERLSDLDGDTHMAVQEFIVNELVLPWNTGIGTIEAIDHMVDEAVANSELAFNGAEATFPEGLDLYFLVMALKVLKKHSRGNEAVQIAYNALRSVTRPTKKLATPLVQRLLGG